jgi:hypothetical protein
MLALTYNPVLRLTYNPYPYRRRVARLSSSRDGDLMIPVRGAPFFSVAASSPLAPRDLRPPRVRRPRSRRIFVTPNGDASFRLPRTIYVDSTGVALLRLDDARLARRLASEALAARRLALAALRESRRLARVASARLDNIALDLRLGFRRVARGFSFARWYDAYSSARRALIDVVASTSYFAWGGGYRPVARC